MREVKFFLPMLLRRTPDPRRFSPRLSGGQPSRSALRESRRDFKEGIALYSPLLFAAASPSSFFKVVLLCGPLVEERVGLERA